MPELPEVETVRRDLAATLVGRRLASIRLSGLPLRVPISKGLARRLRGRAVVTVRRHGKFLLIELDGGWTLLSHLGMSGRWLFFRDHPDRDLRHVHLRGRFMDGAHLWYQDPRRFGLLRLVATARLGRDPAFASLGPDPVASPLDGKTFQSRMRGGRLSIKAFLLDQRRVAGIGNIYASEILHRARVDPRRRAGTLRPGEWEAVAVQTGAVLGEAIERCGTTFSMYRTPWNEPGAFGEQLRVYERAEEPCLHCGTPIRRIVQGQRSTFFCPSCQGRRARSGARVPPPRTRGRPSGRAGAGRP